MESKAKALRESPINKCVILSCKKTFSVFELLQNIPMRSLGKKPAKSKHKIYLRQWKHQANITIKPWSILNACAGSLWWVLESFLRLGILVPATETSSLAPHEKILSPAFKLFISYCCKNKLFSIRRRKRAKNNQELMKYILWIYLFSQPF